jgi:hypothetical protein
VILDGSLFSLHTFSKDSGVYGSVRCRGLPPTGRPGGADPVISKPHIHVCMYVCTGSCHWQCSPYSPNILTWDSKDSFEVVLRLAGSLWSLSSASPFRPLVWVCLCMFVAFQMSLYLSSYFQADKPSLMLHSLASVVSLSLCPPPFYRIAK